MAAPAWLKRFDQNGWYPEYALNLPAWLKRVRHLWLQNGNWHEAAESSRCPAGQQADRAASRKKRRAALLDGFGLLSAADMRPLGAASRIEALLLGSVLVILVAISAWFIVLKFALSWPFNAVLAGAIVGVAGVRALQTGAATERASIESHLPSIAIITAAAAWVIWTYWDGAVLPGHDSINVPAMADGIARGVLPIESYRPGDNAYSYPPGYPIAFVPIALMLEKVTALTAFKAMSLLAAALIPASWAWLLIRLFPTSTPVWMSLLLSYVVFFGLERTLMFGAGGKNSTYLMELLTPPVILILLQTSRRWRDAPFGALALFGLLLIHYSALHLVACMIAGFVLVDLARRELDIHGTVMLAMMGGAAAAMLLLLYGEALADPRSETFWHTDIQRALESMLLALTAESNTLLVIFHEVDVLGLARSPYRGLLLVASAGIALLVWLRLRTRDTANMAAGAIACLVAIVVALAMATQLVPARIKPEYVRWFLWTVQGELMLCGGLAIVTFVTAFRARKVLAAACALTALATMGPVVLKDGVAFRRANAWLAIHRAELQQFRALLLQASDPQRPCFLIGQSEVEVLQVAFVHQSTILDYAEFLTPCTFVNGGWLRGPVPGGRALDGYPPSAVLNDLLHDGSVLFVGAVDARDTYASRIGLDFRWTDAGTVSGQNLWRIEPGV
jgi:hypothetical protein